MTPLAERFRDRLPLPREARIVSLGEGSTPLLRADALSEELGVDLWLKLESANPTGSFKDRGMTVAVSCALARGARSVVCASTGNTAASAAAYAARAGLVAAVLLPRDAVARGKLAQARAVGARLLEVRGSFDEALRAAVALAERDESVTLVNSLNPDRLEGQKTVAFEIVEQLGRVPDVVALPYGGGGNTRAVARGFAEVGTVPRLFAGAAARRADTFASAIRIVEPAHAVEAERAIADSGGSVVTLTDEDLEGAWHLLAEREGVFCEPASAAGVAALRKSRPAGTAVALVTGHGLKDTAAADRVAHAVEEVAADPDAIAAALR